MDPLISNYLIRGKKVNYASNNNSDKSRSVYQNKSWNKTTNNMRFVSINTT